MYDRSDLNRFKERFWERVEKHPEDELALSRGCWIYEGNGETAKFFKRNPLPQQLAYILANDVDPKVTLSAFAVIATCGTEKCVNPDHLEPRREQVRNGKLAERTWAWIVDAERRRLDRYLTARAHDESVLLDFVYGGMPMQRVMQKHCIRYSELVDLLERNGYRRMSRWAGESKRPTATEGPSFLGGSQSLEQWSQ
jgi:hypothetical protein